MNQPLRETLEHHPSSGGSAAPEVKSQVLSLKSNKHNGAAVFSLNKLCLFFPRTLVSAELFPFSHSWMKLLSLSADKQELEVDGL